MARSISSRADLTPQAVAIPPDRVGGVKRDTLHWTAAGDCLALEAVPRISSSPLPPSGTNRRQGANRMRFTIRMLSSTGSTDVAD